MLILFMIDWLFLVPKETLKAKDGLVIGGRLIDRAKAAKSSN